MGECKPLAGRGLLEDLIKDMDSLSQEQKTVYLVSRGSLNPQGPLDKEHGLDPTNASPHWCLPRQQQGFLQLKARSPHPCLSPKPGVRPVVAQA